jgi:hypothetical protein
MEPVKIWSQGISDNQEATRKRQPRSNKKESEERKKERLG